MAKKVAPVSDTVVDLGPVDACSPLQEIDTNTRPQVYATGEVVKGVVQKPRVTKKKIAQRLLKLEDMLLDAVDNQGGLDFVNRIAEEYPLDFLKIMTSRMPKVVDASLSVSSVRVTTTVVDKDYDAPPSGFLSEYCEDGEDDE